MPVGRHLTAPGLRASLLVGGTTPKEATRELAQGTDIVTGTPGAGLPTDSHHQSSSHSARNDGEGSSIRSCSS